MTNKESVKKCIFLLIGIIFIIAIIGFVNSATQSWPAFNVCCEKTTNNAWCQNTQSKDCDTSIDPKTNSPFRVTPTSCGATSFCKPGCCIDTSEGLCMENTPERVCANTPGTWIDDSKCNIQQCQLGCCILGDQASYVTLTRCKKLSADYGLNTNFKREIKDEANCVLQAQLQDKGACIFEVENIKTCKFVTRDECLNTNKTKTATITSQTTFYKNYLCSADELGTNCGPTTKTTCIEGKDEVYFVDTCGNPANIYDASKTYDKDPAYWTKIVSKAMSCKFNDAKGNSGSKTCGNCQYFKGSICSSGTATYGDNICKDLNCYNTKDGSDHKNGESWCIYQGEVGSGRDLVGSRHYRHVCINGEEIVEACADYRNERCIENTLTTYDGSFIEAACRPNRNKDCIGQLEQADCLNGDKRDCYWISGAFYNGSTSGGTLSLSNTTAASGSIKINSNKGGNRSICLPDNPSGLQHWSGSDSQSICSQATVVETVIYEKGIIGGKKCSGNCQVLESDWAAKMNNICTSLGDCGAYFNVAGKYTDRGAEWINNGKKQVIQGLLENIGKKASKTI